MQKEGENKVESDNLKVSILDHRIAGWYLPWMMKGLIPTSCSLENKMRTVQKLGFAGYGTSTWELISFYQERGDLAQLKPLSQELRIPLTAFGFLADGWAFSKGKSRRNAIILSQYSLDLARYSGCDGPYITGPLDTGDLHQAAGVFREMCQYAAQFGMKVALEFFGKAEQVNSLKVAGEFLELVGLDNAGVALDSYHFFAGPSTFKDLEAFPLSKIHLVHLADGPADLSDPAIELDRQMPGEGQLPLLEFVQVLMGKGFDGFWHVESIQGRDYAADFAEVAERALRSTTKLLKMATSTLSRKT